MDTMLDSVVKTKKIEIGASEKTLADITCLSRELGVSRSEMVRHALELLWLLRQSIEGGAEVLIKKGERIEKVVGI